VKRDRLQAGHRVIPAVALLALLAGGCGSAAGTARETTPTTPHAKRGGTLEVLNQGDVDSLDPGITYYTAGYQVTGPTQRTVLNYKPGGDGQPVADLATGLPAVSADGKTVTVKLRSGVRFSPPVNREVTSADVKYAIERAFFNTVNNGYVSLYFGNVVGAKTAAKPGTKISGITTPDAHTVVFKLTRSTGGALAGALSLPVSAPVPESYAAPFDAKNPSAYAKHVVATGPYMVANDAKGNTVGYKPGSSIDLVRNPNWVASTDYRPAYLDEIKVSEGNDDTSVAARRILAGSHMVSGEFPVPAPVIAKAVKTQRDQLSFVSSGQLDYMPLNTAIAPFNDINVRKAVVADIDRNALRQTAGGPVRGPLATHFLPPGIPGFAAAGGEKGPGDDFLASPTGNAKLAADYMRKAGYASGRYGGSAKVFIASINDDGNKRAAAIVQQSLTGLGFKVTVRYMSAQTLFTKYCTVPRAQVNICVGFGWIRDFPDGQAILDSTFNGKRIPAAGNSNVSQLDVPGINTAIAKGELLSDPATRANAWANVDRLVTAQAPAILGTWSNQPIVRSKDVDGAASGTLDGWDFSFTSLR
jgi:peptide/nickel transport system substrate-binding protein